MTFILARMVLLRTLRLNAGARFPSKRNFSDVAGQSEVNVEKLTGDRAGIGFLTMNRPQGKNSFSRKFLSEFEACLQSLMQERSMRVLILRSVVPGVFCAGADLKERYVTRRRTAAGFI